MASTGLNSHLTQTGVSTWLGNHYKDEINREVKWYGAWANHYYNQGGVGVALAAMEIVPLAVMHCPFLNVITYFALSYIFHGKQTYLMKGAIDEGNATAAYIMTERGADPKATTKSGKTLLDLFAEKGESNKGFSLQDLSICTSLLKKGVTANFSQKGFFMMLDTALDEKNYDLALPLLTKGVEPTKSWSTYLPQPSEKMIKVPKWADISLPTVSFKSTYGGSKHIPLGTDMTLEAAKNQLPSHSSKETRLEPFLRIFGQESRNCPLILGEDENERESLVHAFAREILLDKVPTPLKKKQIVGIDLEQLDNLGTLNEIRSLLGSYKTELKSNPNFIFYVHNFDIFDRSTKNSHHEIQKQIIEWAETGRVIFSMKPSVYDRFLGKERLAQKAFTPFEVSKPSAEECLPLLHQMKRKLEIRHQVTFASQAPQAAIFMTRYLKNPQLPQTPYEILDAAATLMKEQETSGSFALQDAKQKKSELLFEKETLALKNGSASQKRLAQVKKSIKEQDEKIEALLLSDENERSSKAKFTQLKAQKAFLESLDDSHDSKVNPLLENVTKKLENLDKIKNTSNIKFEVDRELIARVVSERANMPLSQVHGDEASKLGRFAEILGAEVIGQDAAVQATADAIVRARAGFQDESKPKGVFLYAGSTGVGKTELAKTLAKTLFGDARNMTRLDMSEYSEKHSKSRLIGSPPGYVGSREGGQLTEALKNNPYQVVLIDEVEKASPEVLTTFLQVFDDGRLTDGTGNTVDCTQAIFIMTTNLGSRELMENGSAYTGAWRLLPNCMRRQPTRTPEQIIQSAIINSTHFPPELYNRVDATIPFMPLTDLNVVKQIAEKILKGVQSHTMNRHGIELTWTDRAVTRLATDGRSPLFGARPLKRLIERTIQTRLAKDLVAGNIKEGDSVQVDYDRRQGAYIFAEPVATD